MPGPNHIHSDKGARGLVLRALAVAFWLAVWQLAAWAVGTPLLLAGPFETCAALARLVPTAGFWQTVGSSAASILGGFIGACALGCTLGSLAGLRPGLAVLLEPVASALKTVPVACLIVVLLLWVGTAGVTAASVFLVVFPAYYFTMLEAVRRRDQAALSSLRLMGVGRFRRALVVGWPGAVPFLRATSSTVVGMSWKAGVAAELIGLVSLTLGERVYQAKLLLETADLFAWTAVVVACAWLAEKGFLWLLDKSALWLPRLAVVLAPRTSTVAAEHVDKGARLEAADKGARFEAADHANEGSCCVRADKGSHLEAAGKGSRQVFVGRDAGLYLDDVSVARDGTEALSGLTLSVAPGETLCLMGPSGEGKTTALLALAGLVVPESGSSVAPDRLAMARQETVLVPSLDALDNARLVCPRDRWAAAGALVGELLGNEGEGRPCSAMSGGQRKRAELARALASTAPALLLDEPFSGLDDETHRGAAAVLLANQGGRPCIVTTHDERDIDLLSARVQRL